MDVSASEHHNHINVMLSDGRTVTRTAELSLHCPLLSLWRTLEECWHHPASQRCSGCTTARPTSQENSQEDVPIFCQTHSVPANPASPQ